MININCKEVVVFISGCFDILHRGHFELIEFASLCNPKTKIIIALDTDEKVKKDKGINRPFNTLEDRMYALSLIKFIDQIKSFNSEEELIQMLKIIQPDVRIVGSDWEGKKIVGEEYCKEIVYFDRIPGYSTTRILEHGNLHSRH